MAGTLADILSVASELECDGKVFQMREPNTLEQGKFQRWLEKRAYEAIERADYRSDADRERALNALTRDIAAGAYEWNGEIASRAVLSESGAAKLVELICDVSPPEAKKIIKTHLRRIVAIITAASTDDPKALSAALAALGLKSDFLQSGNS